MYTCMRTSTAALGSHAEASAADTDVATARVATVVLALCDVLATLVDICSKKHTLLWCVNQLHKKKGKPN